jgi:hypothetical protein
MIFCLQIDAENACKNQRRPVKNLRLLPLSPSLSLFKRGDPSLCCWMTGKVEW